MSHISTFSDYAAQLRHFIAEHSTRAAPFSNHSLEEQQFQALALALFRLQWAGNAPYRRWCESLGFNPGQVSDWRQIPAMPAAAFKELELTSLPPHERTAVFCSSGTTGQRPSRHFHNAESLQLYEASLRPWFFTHFLMDKEKTSAFLTRAFAPLPRLLFLTPPPAAAPHSSLVYMFETISRAPAFADQAAFFGGVDASGAWVLDVNAALEALRIAVQTGQPVALLGTAFNFVHLLDQANDLRLKLPAGSRLLETGGYKGRSRVIPKTELHRWMTTRLGVPPSHIVCEYGMCELSSQAYDLQVASAAVAIPERTFQFPPWARVQIISPETGNELEEGQTGLIRVFDLANARSVLAVQTEDLGVRRGAGFVLRGRAVQAEPRGCSLMAP
jgi:hypothetical protein